MFQDEKALHIDIQKRANFLKTKTKSSHQKTKMNAETKCNNDVKH